MNFPFRDWTPYPRRFPFPLRVSTTNFLIGKTYWIRRVSQNHGFSFLFRGRGEMRWRNQVIPLEAPCAMSGQPGEYSEHGPHRPEDAWDELYFTCHPSSADYLRRAHLSERQFDVWPIRNLGTIWSLAQELAEAVNAVPLEAQADRVDRICERMVVESLAPVPTKHSGEDLIQHVLNRVRKHPGEQMDILETARHCGMSEATFRRRWSELVGESPRRYVEQIRLQEACRLLVETKRPIKDIAYTLGFEDEFYFSRRFHVRMGVSPRQYRQDQRG